MIFAKELILKGVAGLAVVGGLGAGGIYVWNQRKGESLETLIKKVGLKDCSTSGSVCTFDAQGLNLKQDSEKGKKTKSSTGSTSGKIKVYKEEGYNKGFKFVIEEGDISLNNGSTTPSKLEEFETYEIKKEENGNDWYLTRREKAVDVKKKLLGLPNVDTCKLPENDSPAECQLDAAKLKAIKFDGKTDGDVTIEGADNNGEQIKLKISKVTDKTNTPFTEGYKFVLETNKNITIPGTTSISIKKGTNTEFKIKKGTDNKTLTLEKAWDIDKLAEKVGLENCTKNGSSNTCTFKTNTAFGLMENESTKITDAKVTEESKTISYEKDVEGHGQGFKFFTSQEITISSTESGKKIEGSSTATYEIIEKTESGSTKWYLSKRGVGS